MNGVKFNNASTSYYFLANSIGVCRKLYFFAKFMEGLILFICIGEVCKLMILSLTNLTPTFSTITSDSKYSF